MAERSDAHAIEHRSGAEQFDERIDAGVALGVDVEVRVGKRFEEVGEERYRFASVDTGRGDRGPRKFGDSTLPTAGSLQVVVVERDEHSVGGQMHVGLEVAVSECVGVGEGGQCVLWSIAGSAAVGEGDEASVVVRSEIGVTTSLHSVSIVGSMGIQSSTVTPILLAGEKFTGHGTTIEVRRPYDGSLIGQVPACTAEDVDRAVASAGAALRRGLPLWRRAAVLDAAASAVTRHREELARIVADEAAKPLRTARIEVDRAAGTFSFSAAEARKLAGDVVPLDALAAGEGKVGFTMRVPIGVVAAIAPFNFPLNLVAHKVAPAIAAGCPVVLKPASQTPYSSIRLIEILVEECDLPVDWVSVVTGGGGTVGNALVDHSDVALVTFTGSPDVGWGIRARAPRKRVGLELGNNAPVIIEPTGDWRTAAAKIRIAGFSHAGQSCISTQRILVHRSIAGQFVDELVAQVSTLVVGDPLDEATEVSSLISTSERDRVSAWIAEAVGAGATIACGGDVTAQGVLRPTVVLNARPDMKICAGEVFGPVVAVTEYDEVDDALRMANDSAFGLQAAIFTSDIAVALRAVRELDYGGVLVNEVPTWRADQQPYGGLRDSGNTREGPAYTIREMTEIKMVVLGA